MSMGFCLDCHRDPASHVREKADIFNLGLEDDRRVPGDRGRAQVRARLEDQTPAKLLGLPPMKRKIEHPAPSERATRRAALLAEPGRARGDAGIQGGQLKKEFPEGASSLEGVDRRQFMKIMAASFALGGVGLAGCRRPEEHILPFGKSVEGAVPGLPVYYATAMPMRGWAIPLLAETHQGRPTKLEGNPAYAPHGGSSSLLAQASILDLYDPDRATQHTKDGQALDPDAVKALLSGVGKAHLPTQGAGLAFLVSASSSPTRSRMARMLHARFPKSLWAEYEPVTDEPPVTVARKVLGANVRPIYRFAKAKRIVSLDCDFLHVGSGEPGLREGLREGPQGREEGRHDEPPLHGGEQPLDHGHDGGPPAAAGIEPHGRLCGGARPQGDGRPDVRQGGGGAGRQGRVDLGMRGRPSGATGADPSFSPAPTCRRRSMRSPMR